MEKSLTLVIGAILVLSVAGAFSPAAAAEEHDQEIVLVRDVGETEDISDLEEAGDVLDRYGRYVLLEMPESAIGKLEPEYNIDELEHRSQLNIKGHEFDTDEGLPDFDPELTIDEYEPGTEGLYIVDMIGPVNPEWREELEDMGVEVINYQPNYAYEVVMTPELAEEVEELFFVEWVGIYQPGLKLPDNLGEGTVNIYLVANEDIDSVEKIEELVDIQTYDLPNDRISIKAEIENESSFSRLAQIPAVYYIDEYIIAETHDEMATQITGGGTYFYPSDWKEEDGAYRDEGNYGSLVNQLGYKGGSSEELDGVVIAVADTGVGNGTPGTAGHPDFGHPDPDIEGRILDGMAFDDEGPDPDGCWADDVDPGTASGHGTHVAGSIAGNTYIGTEENTSFEENANPYYKAVGSAPLSLIYPQDLWNNGSDTPSDKYGIFEDAKQNGSAYIHSNSWGDHRDSNIGRYTKLSSVFDMAVRDANSSSSFNEPMVITTSTGNEGAEDNTVAPPSTGKNVISVGATENYYPSYGVENPEAVSGFSSRGWTNDNRIKPDVVAPGENVNSTYPGSPVGDIYNTMWGTSMSNPNVAGQAAVIVEWYEDNYGEKPSPAMVKALLINTAEELDPQEGNTGHIPNKAEGWGMVNLVDLVHQNGPNFILEDQSATLRTGQEHEYAVSYENEAEPLKMSLVWTDNEGSWGADPALKNDLNLEVVGPDGNDVYRGNAFDEIGDGKSDSGFTYSNTDAMSPFDSTGDGWDDRNNVQNVYIHPDDLEPGTYTVRIMGENVPEDANNDGYANQDYALVVQNGIQSTLHHDDEDFDLNPDPRPKEDDGDYTETIDIPGSREEIQVQMDYTLDPDWGYSTDISLYLDGIKRWGDEKSYLDPTPSKREMSKVFHLFTDPDEFSLKVEGDGDGDVIMHEITVSARGLLLTMDAKEGGTTDPEPGNYAYPDGEEVTVSAIPDSDWLFDEWTGDVPTGEEEEEEITITMDEDKEITAEFRDHAILTIDSSSGGSTDPPEGTHTYSVGEEIDLSANPYWGYEFHSWTVNDETYSDPDITVTMDEDKDAYASFLPENGPTSLDSSYDQYLEEGPVAEELVEGFNDADLSLPGESDEEEAVLAQESDQMWNVLVDEQEKYIIMEAEDELLVYPSEEDS